MADPVWVELGDRRYPVFQEAGGADAVAAHVDGNARPGRLLVLSDSNVGPRHASTLAASLRERGRIVRALEVPAGEDSKSVGVIGRLWTEALAGDFDRGDTVVAVGGGVVGDLGGFLASTLMRGVDVVQVPTTVLAMADAAIGGKTGINLARGKNLVGTFHQPRAVVQWVGSLGSLPERERRSGVAEVVKSMLLAGEDDFAWLEEHGSALSAGEPAALSESVRRSAALKADIVSRDEREGGARKLLNLGHTLGHVIEQATGYGSWTHGEAVAAGIVLEMRLGIDRGIGDVGLLARVRSALIGQKLPVEPPSLRVDDWTGPLRVDKKRRGDDIEFVLCEGPGRCRIVPISLVTAVAWLKTL